MEKLETKGGRKRRAKSPWFEAVASANSTSSVEVNGLMVVSDQN